MSFLNSLRPNTRQLDTSHSADEVVEPARDQEISANSVLQTSVVEGHSVFEGKDLIESSVEALPNRRSTRTQSCHANIVNADVVHENLPDHDKETIHLSMCSETPPNIGENMTTSGAQIPSFSVLNPFTKNAIKNSLHLENSFVKIMQAVQKNKLIGSDSASIVYDTADGHEKLSTQRDLCPTISGCSTWNPVDGIIQSKESIAFEMLLGHILAHVLREISLKELEIRANAPEYKVLEEDWVAHSEKNQRALITPLKTVARLPADLILNDAREAEIANLTGDPVSAESDSAKSDPTICGYLRKRGETNKSFKRRYMELNGTILTYYKKKPAKKSGEAYARGSIDLEKVSSLQPLDSKTEKYGIVLVTTSRSWEIAAENEQEYHRWLKELCDTVKFYAVHITYKRMFQLQEVSAKAITDVRMVIPTSDTVAETVEHIFNCYKQALDAAPLKHYNPRDYLLKITGYRDYLIDPDSFMNQYMHVRECLLTKKTIRLTVIHKSVIQEIATRRLSITSELSLTTIVDKGDQHRMQIENCLLSQEESNTLDNLREKVTDHCVEQAVCSNDIPSGSLHEPLVVCIHRILNIPKTISIRKRTSEHSVIEHKALTATNVFVRAELYYGGKLVSEYHVETSSVRLRSQNESCYFAEWIVPSWLHFDHDICNLSRGTRIMLTVYGIKKNSMVPSDTLATAPSHDDETEVQKMLVTGINLFDVDGVLAQGVQYVAMYNNLHMCTQGPVPHQVLPKDPILHIEYPNFNRLIRFDWSEAAHDTVSSVISRRSIVQNRLSTVRKEGWLHKLGYTRWTRWRRRWFILDQEPCVLSYADDQKSPRKLIYLRGCKVSVADFMNEKYTTAPVNKGTRKERHTYCFKLRPEKSTRDYFISAETKQEREEWMLAILTVSKYDSSLSMTTMNEDSIECSMRNERSSENEENSQGHVDSDLEKDRVIEDESMSLGPKDGNPMDDGRSILASFAQDLRRDSSVSTVEIGSQKKQQGAMYELQRVILMDPLYCLSPYQKAQMWSHHEDFIEIPAALPRILSCVNWGDKQEIEEALDLLPRWASPNHKAAYIELLDGEYPHEGVRSFAVSKIAEMADTTLSYFLPQLVQAIKFENHHVSPIASLLIERAIRNPNQIGFDLFWSMKVESHHEQYRERYGVLLNGYLKVCSVKMRAILKLQDKLFSADGVLDKICQKIKAKKKDGADEMKRVMQEQLTKLNEALPGPFQLPIDPRIEVGHIIVSKCRVMDSAKKPLWLVFENAEQGGDPVTIMFKSGDDVRQDCLTLQLIRLMDEMWRDEGLELAMEPYRCVATSPMTGVLQVVPNSVTTADIHKRVGILGAFKDPSFSEWIHANNPDRRSHKAAVDLFRRSCAGYCVATCVLGIGDRHNDNIMISTTGRYFHIDFGHFLGHFKYQLGMKRERTPFVFTKEMAHVLGGTDSKEFKEFVDTSCTAYCILRKHMHLLVSLLLLMVPADMPELTGRDDINHLVTALAPEVDEVSARESFAHAIHFCLDSKFKRIDNTIHILAHVLS